MRLWVLDMGAICGWCYYGKPDEPEGMISGLDGVLWEIRAKLNPTHMVACIDSGNNFRKVIDPTYKGKRKDKPQEYIDQLRRVPDVLAEHGITWVRQDTFEADDVVASVVAKHSGDDCECIIVSTDKDLMSLVSESDNVRQYDPRYGVFYDEAAVKAKLGVYPHSVPALLAMAGDTADGIRGIKDVGKDTAIKALRQVRSVAELFRRARAGTLEGIQPRRQKLIADGAAQYDAALKLVRLRYDVEVPSDVDAFALLARAS